MLEKIRQILSDHLGLDPEDIVESASFKDDLGIDSLDLFEMILSLEDEYHVQIPVDDLTSLDTVGDALKYFAEHHIG